MYRPLTKESVKQFQVQVLSHFQNSTDPQERAALLDLAQALERTIQMVQARKKEAKDMAKDLSLIDRSQKSREIWVRIGQQALVQNCPRLLAFSVG
jgi:phage anti-repressor protein